MFIYRLFSKDPPTIAKALSRVLIVPETMSAQRLLNLFIRDQKSVAVVVDEFGITAGIVTIEDIMEKFSERLKMNTITSI